MNPDVLFDIVRAGRWPWLESSIDEVWASHVLEHIPAGSEFFHVLREIHRVCKPGAKVDVILPHPTHDVFLNDPTHVQAIMPGTLALFSKRFVESQAALGNMLTPFYAQIGVDFDIKTVRYTFDESIDLNDPELEWKAKHLRNVILEWSTTLTVIK